jgi:peptide/nickel transport system ATP-binding protein
VSALEVEGVTVTFGTGRHALVAVDSVDLTVPEGGVVGLVGESGSGKSTLARAIVGLVPRASGRVLVKGADAASPSAAGRRLQMVFQDPYTSLNPRMTVGETLDEALAVAARLPRGERRSETERLLELVALDRAHTSRLPRELSGGQRQRVAIARALAAKPDVLIADEITAALDVSVQGQIINLLREIQASLGLSVLFISHNLALVRYVCDTAAVMYLGRIVETAPIQALLARPEHPYTQTLLEAVPKLGPARVAGAPSVEVEPADPHARPAGCHFHPRCPVGPMKLDGRAVCMERDPWDDAQQRPHGAACHFAGVQGSGRDL